MISKITTSIKLQKTLHHKMLQRIISDGYGMRGKSRWIIEAIELFLNLSDFPYLTYLAEDMDQLNEIISIRVPEELAIKLDKAIIAVRRDYPAMEGVQSNLIRASIMQRLIRHSTSVTE